MSNPGGRLATARKRVLRGARATWAAKRRQRTRRAARFSPERWRVVTLDMRERGAKIEDQELERLVEWLGRTKGTNDSDRQ